MNDLNERLRDLDRLEAPDLWLAIVDRAQATERDARPIIVRTGVGRPGMLIAATSAVLAVLIVGLFASPLGGPASVLAVIDQARSDFGEVRPFRAEVVTSLDADVIAGERPGYRGPDAMIRRIISYVGPDRWRRDIVENPLGILEPAAGSYTIWNGEVLGVYHADEHWFQTEPSNRGQDPLGWLSWDRADQFWHDACADGAVLADDQIAGRSATHLRCDTFEIWIDAETGLILKHLTPESSEEVIDIAYDASFEAAVFEVTPPAGAAFEAPEPQTHLVVGTHPAGWNLRLLEGGELSLDQLVGSRSLILVWADWCDRACTDALDRLERFIDERTDWRAVSIVIDSAADTTGTIVADQAVRLAVAVDDGTIATDWGVSAVPTLVVLDEHGRVMGVHAGSAIRDELTRLDADR